MYNLAISSFAEPTDGTDRQAQDTLSIRLSNADLTLIDRAAALRSCSRAKFVHEAAVAAAEDALIEQTSARMSADGFRAFMEALSGPLTVASEIIELFQRRAPWE